MIPPWSIWYKKHRGRWLGVDISKEVQEAFREGRLVRKPCVICGAIEAHAHHPDYAKPLAVIFLCQRHHMRFHYLLGKRFWLSRSQRYTQRFHDQVLRVVEREFLEPELPLFTHPSLAAAK